MEDENGLYRISNTITVEEIFLSPQDVFVLDFKSMPDAEMAASFGPEGGCSIRTTMEISRRAALEHGAHQSCSNASPLVHGEDYVSLMTRRDRPGPFNQIPWNINGCPFFQCQPCLPETEMGQGQLCKGKGNGV